MRTRSFSNLVVTLATASSVVVASPTPHHHHHVHLHERIVKTVNVPGPTVIAYDLNGHQASQSEVCAGLKDGTLKWKDGTVNPPACPYQLSSVDPSALVTVGVPNVTPTTLSSQPTTPTRIEVSIVMPFTTSSPATTDVSVIEAANVKTSPNASLSTSAYIAAPSPSKASASVPVASASPSVAAQSPIEISSSVSTMPISPVVALSSPKQASSLASINTPAGQGLDTEFPDGELDCTTFPSEYGPIEIEWAKIGGWSGIQYVTVEGNTVTHIENAVPGGEGCKPGAMCSYACPPGYQKSQWPSAQGATGQSVGGISCNADGKLILTNPDLSKKLCIPGTGAVTVQNKMSNNAAICRTDYPGTEDETVPLNTEPESTSPLTCPDASTYFTWEGESTTAQYYVNNQGVPLQEACIWDTDGSDMGNWAPSYFGVGQDVNGKTWLSIASTAQNDPSSYTPLNYTVRITGDTSGKCGLSNGQYCSGDNYNDCNTLGCTVELLSGQATYVLENGSSLSD